MKKISLWTVIFMKKWEAALLLGLTFTLLWSAARMRFQTNWWCVIYPDLCQAAVVEWDGPDDEPIAPAAGDTPRYQLKFRTVELWQAICQKLGK